MLKEKRQDKHIIRINSVIRLILVAALFLLMWKTFLPLFLVILGTLSIQHERFTIGWLGLDLYTLSMIVASATAGPLTGIFIGVGSRLLNLALIPFISPFIIVKIIVVGLTAYLASFFPAQHVLVWGIYLVVFQDIVLFLMSFIVKDDPFSNISYMVTHLITNTIIFQVFGPTLLMLFS